MICEVPFEKCSSVIFTFVFCNKYREMKKRRMCCCHWWEPKIHLFVLCKWIKSIDHIINFIDELLWFFFVQYLVQKNENYELLSKKNRWSIFGTFPSSPWKMWLRENLNCESSIRLHFNIIPPFCRWRFKLSIASKSFELSSFGDELWGLNP